MKIYPLHNFIVVKRLESEHITVGGILIPDAATEKPNQGCVIAASAGKKLQNGTLRLPDVKVGDIVLFDKYAGQPVSVDGDELLVMREVDVIGVVEA